ncbi:hypothetical protein BOX15_Mlig012690g1, partial [Macrostomum lignano]
STKPASRCSRLPPIALRKRQAKMPFPQRVVQPVAVTQTSDPLPKSPDLTFTNNVTLGNLLSQMSCISAQASGIFSGLASEMQQLVGRTRKLASKAERLGSRVERLVRDQDPPPIDRPETFASRQATEQGLLTPSAQPDSVRSLRAAAEPAPALDGLDQLRDDDRKGMSLYSDPEFFFRLWAQQMLDQAAKVAKQRPEGAGAAGRGGKRQNRKKRKKPRQVAKPNYEHEARRGVRARPKLAAGHRGAGADQRGRVPGPRHQGRPQQGRGCSDRLRAGDSASALGGG